MAQTDYSLDVRELRRRLKDAFLLLDGCGGEAASYAFDDFGRGAMVIDDPCNTQKTCRRPWMMPSGR